MLGRETLGLEILLLLQTNPANKSKEEMNDFKRSALRPFVFLCKARPVFGANINVEKTAAILNVMFFSQCF